MVIDTREKKIYIVVHGDEKILFYIDQAVNKIN